MSWKIKVMKKPHANAGGPDWWVGEKKYTGWYIASMPVKNDLTINVIQSVYVFGSGSLALKFGKHEDAIRLVAELQLIGCHKHCACRDNNALAGLELEECA